ncbi:hypothetical protein ACFVSN_30605 [Kitasatospora sp. NPDC057904]|uniref:hypothetical protein n=1 Tax=Kitasatospora sp. NPDC057904 TaxID=3346275 RepID=UPI0036DE7B65
MADTSTQSRGAVRKALKELTEAGFYRVELIRLPDGTLRSEAHVYDVPRLVAPGAVCPASGGAGAGRAGRPVVKNRHEEPSLPAGPDDSPVTAAVGRPEGREAGPGSVPDPGPVADEAVREAVAILFRVIRPEPRLRLGESEARELAPLVAQWLERGSTPGDLAQALLPGLPTPMHSAVAVLRYRLEHKMPPVRTQERHPARYLECGQCHDPVPRPGICRSCAGLGSPPAAGKAETTVATRGAARARAALLTARTAFSTG